MDRVYCYEGTNVLKNKLNIRDQNKLQAIERKLTSLRVLDLLEKPVRGLFDFKHLMEIHRYIFQDLYNWAGHIRIVDIAKGNMFCKAQFIQSQADEIFTNHRFFLCNYDKMETLFKKCLE